MKHILPINEGWAFVKGCETAPAAIPAGAARVDLPHCWNALDLSLIHISQIQCESHTLPVCGAG